MTRREASIVGTPIPGLGSVDVVTTEQDWVITGVHRGQPFRRYVTPNVTKEQAIAHAARVMRLTPDGLEWITANRRHEVERCVRIDGDWLRSRTL
jgi:hypothetical protein